jgi:hypothetical protein
MTNETQYIRFKTTIRQLSTFNSQPDSYHVSISFSTIPGHLAYPPLEGVGGGIG